MLPLIELTDEEGRLISIAVYYDSPGNDNHAAYQSVLRMLEVAAIAEPQLFMTKPCLVHREK